MSFHTKTIERILNPVAQQVSKLIILFEDSDAGAEIPDLEMRVNVVKMAVDNLVKVGRETIADSSDALLREDMPPSLKRVEDASYLLQEAVVLLHQDPFSSLARRKLIEGSRGILQGTSSVLLTFDMSEVRKIIGICRTVLNVLVSAELVDSLSRLADFVKKITPCMAQMIKEVDNRQEELVTQTHAALLRRGIEQVKRLTPILISALKLYTNTRQNGLPGIVESQSNRDFLVLEMTNEIQDIIRVLQLTGVDNSEWFDDELASMRAAKATLDSRVQFVHDWLRNSQTNLSRAGENAVRKLLLIARQIANLGKPSTESTRLMQVADEIDNMIQKLAEHNLRGELHYPTAQTLVTSCRERLNELSDLCNQLVGRSEHNAPVYRPARTLEGKMVQAQRWLADPPGPHRQVGYEACNTLHQEARELISHLMAAPSCSNNSTADGDANELALDACLEACEHVESAARRLYELTAQPATTEIQSMQQELARAISLSLACVWRSLQNGMVSLVADTFTDLAGPLRQLTDAACPPSGTAANPAIYEDKAAAFQAKCGQTGTAAWLAAGTGLSDMWRAETLRSTASQFNELANQVVLAGQAALLAANQHKQSQQAGSDSGGINTQAHAQATGDHFALMRQHWADNADHMRQLVDETIDPQTFINVQEAGMVRDTASTEQSIRQTCTTGVVEATTSIARRANRVLQVAAREAENSEDARYVDRMNDAVKHLRSTITPMVNDAKGLVTRIEDQQTHDQWRSSNRNLLAAVGAVRQAVGPGLRAIQTAQTMPGALRSPPIQEMQQLVIEGGQARPDTPDTEIEEDFNYPLPEDNQPIMAAAHALHLEARQWSSRDNELIAATKRMAALMAQLSQIVRGEYGTKKDLITVSMAIAEASLDVNSCAKTLAKECTDRRLRTNLMQLSDRILTIGNQLKILSTVKATMLGTQDDSWTEAPVQSELDCGSVEDQENTESLVGNAQNLMQAVIETLHAAEGASIKMRVDSGFKIRWRPRTNTFTTAR